MARKARTTRYRVLAPLSYPVSPSLLAHLAAGGDWPERADIRRAVAGDIVDDIPAGSVPWLLTAGLIVPAEEGDDGAL